MTFNYVYTTWTPDLATGNNIIDDQHKQLIAELNALFDAHRNGKGRKEVEEAMDFLVNYTVKHFNDEEEMLKEHNYPDLDRHHQIHVAFKNVVKGLHTELIAEGPTDDFITHVYTTIGRWVVSHIKGEDFIWAEVIRHK